MKIDWSQHTAEETLEAFKSGVVVMSAWDGPDKVTGLYSRFSRVSAPEGYSKHASVGRDCISGVPYDQSPFHYSLGYAPGDRGGPFETAEQAMRVADEAMRRRGWKLVGDPPPAPEDFRGHGDHIPKTFMRITPYDFARRRALWMRIDPDGIAIFPQELELRAGREGDDARVLLKVGQTLEGVDLRRLADVLDTVQSGFDGRVSALTKGG